MRQLASIAAAFALVLAAAQAAAQPSSPLPPPPPGYEDQAPPATLAGIESDANSSRVFVSPTALTEPAGTWTFNSYELLFMGASYAATDQLTLGFSGLVPITREFPTMVILTGKLQVAQVDRLAIAAHGSINYFDVADSSSSGFGSATLGGVVTYCLDSGCHSYINGLLAAGFALNVDQGGVVPFIVTGGLVQRLGKRVKLVLEVDSGLVLGEINEVSRGFLAWYGLRFTSRNIGAEVGFVRPVCDGCGDVFLAGIPWLGFTYRGGL